MTTTQLLYPESFVQPLINGTLYEADINSRLEAKQIATKTWTAWLTSTISSMNVSSQPRQAYLPRMCGGTNTPIPSM
jgi:hypothetical protein